MTEISKLDKIIKPSGTMLISNKARELREAGKPVIGFGAGEPDFASPDYVVSAAIDAANDPKNHKYSPTAGLESLRKSIANSAHSNSNYLVDPSNIVVTNGGKQAILTALMSLLDSGDEVIIPAPFWTTYPEAVLLAGGKPIFVETSKENDFKISIEDLNSVKTNKTKVLIWCSPSNPTGVVYTKEEAKEIYQWVFNNDLWILSDELYEHLVYEGEATPSPALFDTEFKNTLIVNGVSKAYAMTGWRVGWLIANNKVINLAKKILSQATSNVNNISQLAAEAAINNGLEVTQKMKIAFDSRRRFAIKKIDSINNLSTTKATGAFYLFVNVSHYCSGLIENINSSEEFCNWLLENYYIAFVPGEVFGAPGYMRLSYALSDDELSEGLNRLEKAIKDISG
jgi:aspartate aminotransferase